VTRNLSGVFVRFCAYIVVGNYYTDPEAIAGILPLDWLPGLSKIKLSIADFKRVNEPLQALLLLMRLQNLNSV
jgi:hypothetical protein